MKFLLRYPPQTVEFFLMENNIKDQQWSRFFESMLRNKEDGLPFREVLQRSPNRLIALANPGFVQAQVGRYTISLSGTYFSMSK